MKILFILLLAYIYYHFRKRVPILMYHRIATVKGDRNSLPVEKFEEQMQYLEEKGFHSITMEQLESHILHGSPLPDKPIVLTFDDGYKDNVETALPILKKYHQIGNVFSIANWRGKENKWENFGKELTVTMNDEELLQWQREGNYIGSHTMDHPFLSECEPLRLRDELAQSKEVFDALTEKDVSCICYPYGDFNEEVIEEAKKCGYRLGLGIFYGVPLLKQNPLALPRIPIPARQPMWEFKLKVSSIHLLFVWLRQMERTVKKKARKL